MRRLFLALAILAACDEPPEAAPEAVEPRFYNDVTPQQLAKLLSSCMEEEPIVGVNFNLDTYQVLGELQPWTLVVFGSGSPEASKCFAEALQP